MRGAVAGSTLDQASELSLVLPAKRSDRALAWVRDRHVLTAFIAGVVVAVCWRGAMLNSYTDLSGAILRDRSGVGAGEFLIIAVMLTIAFGLRDEEALSQSDLLAMALTGLAFAPPIRLAAIVPLTVVGVKFALKKDPRLSSMGQLFLALAFYEWLGPLVFHLISPIVLTAETIAVQALLSPIGGFTRDGLVISGGSNGHSISIEEACSAFHNLSSTMLIWISLVKLETLTIKPIHYWLLAAMAGATVALNTARIALMAQSYELYEYWHDGAGGPIVSAAMLAAILSIFLIGRSLAEKH